MTYNRFLQYFDEGGDVLPPAFKEAYDELAPNPDAQYGQGPLGFYAQNKEGSPSWVQQGTNTRLSIPDWLRHVLLGTTDLAAGTQTGEVTPRGLSTLVGTSMGTGAVAAPADVLATGASSYGRALKDIFRRPITVAVPDDVLPKLAKDQRFKTQFETGTSEGSLDPRARARTEQDLFGLPLDLPPEQRPIYGHVTDLSNYDSARSYGQWGAVLDSSVKPRSTFYLDDSLMGDKNVNGPYKFSEGWQAARDKLLRDWFNKKTDFDIEHFLSGEQRYGPRPFKPDEPRTAGMLPRAASFPYVEAQVHGGLPLSDVRALVGKYTKHDPDLAAVAAQKAADTIGLPTHSPWVSMSGMTPRWMRALPGQSVNQVEEVPVSAIKALGYKQGGRIDALREALRGLGEPN